MAQQRMTLATLPAALIEALHETLALKPADDSQRTAQPEMVKEIHTALDARRQRIVISEFALGTVKWVAILLQGLCTLVAIAMVHSDNRLARAIALTLFATGFAMSVLLIAAYSRPFTVCRTGIAQASYHKRGPFRGVICDWPIDLLKRPLWVISGHTDKSPSALPPIAACGEPAQKVRLVPQADLTSHRLMPRSRWLPQRAYGIGVETETGGISI